MALTRLGSLAATNLVLGGNVGTQGDAYKNYNTIFHFLFLNIFYKFLFLADYFS